MSAGEGAPAARIDADIVVQNPVSGEMAGRVSDMTAEVPALVRRARTAQAAWGARPVEERAEVLTAMRRWIVANRTAIVESTMRETGKTYEDALFNEVFVLADSIRFWERKAARHLRDERVRGRGPLVWGRTFIVRRRPHGVVGVIAPWNYPLGVAIGDSAPALMAGNAVVIKPSEITPLTTTMVVDGLVCETGLPEDVLLVATGCGETGAALVDHVDMIMFTGSTRTGRDVARRAANRLIPVSLELGGKDPMIVCADANLDRAANAAATFGLGNCGQVCASVERIYVEDEVHDEFVDKLVRAVGRLRQRGNTSAGAADVGAMTFPPQLEVVERHVADALAKGARVLTPSLPSRRESKTMSNSPRVAPSTESGRARSPGHGHNLRSGGRARTCNNQLQRHTQFRAPGTRPAPTRDRRIFASFGVPAAVRSVRIGAGQHHSFAASPWEPASALRHSLGAGARLHPLPAPPTTTTG